jgi:hypothetical protein
MAEIPSAPGGDLFPALLEVSGELAAIVAAETDLLESQPAPDLTRIVPEKTRLTVRFDALLRLISGMSPEAIKAQPEAPDLALAIKHLDILARRNAKAIERRLLANKRAIGVLAEAARQATLPTFSYGRERLGFGARSGRPSAVAVNRVL